jgi:pyruvate-formate lyase-activating enzyme
MTESKTFCALPWLHRFTNEQGFHQLCCTGDGPLNQLRDAQGKPLNISQGLTDEQVLNSPDLKAVRLGMLEGKWPGACERCRQSESAGAKSIRNHMNDRFRHHVDRVLENTAQDGTLTDPQVIYADIRLGNVCNLTCRMCGPGASRLWADHFNEVQPRRYFMPVEQLKDLRVNNWVKRQSVQWLIDQCLPSVESLHFAGGEPLIIPEMVELLETCIQSGRASQIMLSYNTNITVLPEKVTRLWPHFKNVSVMCSVDAIGPLNDYIRRPSKWNEIDRNLHRLDEHYKEWNLRKAHFNTTVQIYNVLHLADFFDYLGNNFENFDPVPQFTPLYGPGYLSIVNLPDRIKAIARERLIGARDKAQLRLGMTSNLSSVDTILAHMETPGHRMHLAEFLYFSEKTDREFDESWRKACPELEQLLTARA